MSFPITIDPNQANKETPIGENFNALLAAGHYGLDLSRRSGLLLWFFGDGDSITDDDVTCTDNATNYVVRAVSGGALSVATNTTNWDNTSTYARIGRAVFASGVLTWHDHRLKTAGILRGSGSGSGTAGKQSVPIMASGMLPSSSGGCAALAQVAGSSGQPDLITLDFDSGTQEHAQFSIAMPKSWNAGTLTFKAHWSHPTGSGDVIWGLQAVAVSNDDTIAANFGTAQEVTDTGGTAGDLYTTAESSAITVAGSPAKEDVVFFRIYRKAADGGDTLGVDARLHGITLFYTTDAENDA